MIDYSKITYVDNSTPINAANMNKMERAIYKLASNALFASEIKSAGDGISVINNGKKGITLSTKDLISSETVSGIEVINENLFDQDEASSGKIYFVLNDSNKLSMICLGNIVIWNLKTE